MGHDIRSPDVGRCEVRFTAKEQRARRKTTDRFVTTRLMPSLMRMTFQFTRKPSRWSESFRYISPLKLHNLLYLLPRVFHRLSPSRSSRLCGEKRFLSPDSTRGARM